MIEGARNPGTSIRKTAALVKFSRAAVINVYREWIPKQKTRFEFQVCGHHRLLKIHSERRIAKVVHSNRRITTFQIVGNFNQGETTNVYERTVPRTLHYVDYGSRRQGQKPL
ncbi:hypothetical protein TNCV_1180201 [Trichonephila clavipes]|nr:hypothetical protein TNCV_1180201 [Trichonephila clavipes]